MAADLAAAVVPVSGAGNLCLVTAAAVTGTNRRYCASISGLFYLGFLPAIGCAARDRSGRACWPPLAELGGPASFRQWPLHPAGLLLVVRH